MVLSSFFFFKQKTAYEIMELLGLEPGPMIGRAYKHMLEYRLDNGPVDHDVAVAELKRWYAEIEA